MRRRALRMIRRAGLLAPALVVLSGAALAMPADKEHRDRETGRAQARIRPTPGDVVPTDPVAAAFGLFPEARVEQRDEIATANEATLVETVPTSPPAAAVAPGVVAVERIDAPAPEPVPALPPLAFAPALTPPASAVERALFPPVAAPRTLDVPIPRRRPADAPTGLGEGEMRLASLTPETARITTPAASISPIAAEVAVLGEPKRIPKEALPYLDILRREAAANKVPLWLAVGVGWVESKYQPGLRGSHGVVGLMQVMPSTARFQGYRGPAEKLLEPETNIVWGMKELGWDWAKSGGNPCMAIAKYKGGIATTKISPAAADYCRRAKTVTGMM